MTPKKLNLGCGGNYLKNFTNLDYNKENKADVYHNLEKFPYPFKDNEFDYILMDAVLEHLENPVKVLKELKRISKKDSIVKIKVPHFTSTIAFGDLTHKHFFSYDSVNVEEEKGIGFNTYFNVVKTKIKFGKKFAIWNYIIEHIANKFPKLYEGTPLRIFPAFTMEVILKNNKN